MDLIKTLEILKINNLSKGDLDKRELLRLDEIPEKDLLEIGFACKFYQVKKRKTLCKKILNDQIKKKSPKSIKSLLKIIIQVTEDEITLTKANKQYLDTYPYINILTLEKAVELIIFSTQDKFKKSLTKALELIETKLNFMDNGLRTYWKKSDEEICEEIGFIFLIDEIKKKKTKIVKEWFSLNNLDVPSDEQAHVIANCGNSLKVVARAGSGKTRTIAQKILFLIHYIGYSKDQVLALVFNNKAMLELRERVERFEKISRLPQKGSFKIITFDQLAFHIVKPRENICEGKPLKDLIQDLIINALDNEENLRNQVEEILLNSFKGDIEKSLRLEKISSKSDLIRLRSFTTEETLDGKPVKSKGEKRIGDFFFEYEVPYSYERPFTTDEGDLIRPDFYIPKPHNIIIEYCGLKGDPEYERILKFKRDYWLRRNEKESEEDKFIILEINPEFICKSGSSFDDSRESDYQSLIALFQRNIHSQERRINFKRLTDEEIIFKLRSKIQLTFTDLLNSAISRASKLNISDDDLIQRLNQYDTNDENEKSFLDLIPRFISMYKNRLKNNNLTDYDEIKKNAIKKILNGETTLDWDSGKNGVDLRKIQYIFVDEFQDFSQLFKGLLLAILKVAPNALINAVGDDWQMINRFAGSNPELYDEFEETYPKPKTLYLTTNYRSAGRIVEFCNQLMSLNGVEGKPSKAFEENVNKDYLISKIYRDKINLLPREEYLFRGDSILSSIFRIYKPLSYKFSIENRKKEDKICFAISRTNNPPLKVSPGELGIKAKNSRELINGTVNKWTGEYSHFFESTTSHSSKGLEAEGVIIIQPKQFPLINKKSLFLQFFGDTPENLFRDELNLFYVACSRAKSSIIFLTEAEYMMSPFLKDMKGKIKLQKWSTYPCALKTPLNLHVIKITSSNDNYQGLFKAKEILKAFGFAYSCPYKIPTRSIRISKSPLDTLLFLQRVWVSTKSLNLNFEVLDGLNKKVFAFPGHESLKDAISRLSEK